MTAIELRDKVISQFTEGEKVTLWAGNDERCCKHKTQAVIEKFLPSCVQTTHDGYTECFTYWDFLNMMRPPQPKKNRTC